MQWKAEYAEAKKRILAQKGNTFEQMDILWKKDFLQRDAFFDTFKGGPHYLKEDVIAQVVANTLHFWDKKRFDLHAFCIMSNHLHVVFKLYGEEKVDTPVYLEKIMHSIKLYSAKKCNKILGLDGQFWQHESYDRLVRNQEELLRIIKYVLNNPVKAGLCVEMYDWKWSYIREDLKDFI